MRSPWNTGLSAPLCSNRAAESGGKGPLGSLDLPCLLGWAWGQGEPMALGAALSPALVTSIWISASHLPEHRGGSWRLRERGRVLRSAPHSMAVTVPELTPWPLPVTAERPCPLQPPGNNHLSCGRERTRTPLLMAGYWAKTLTTVPWGSSCYCSHLTEEKTEAQEVNSGMGPAPRLGCLRDWISSPLFCPVLLLCSPPQAEESWPMCFPQARGGEALVASGTGWLGEGPRGPQLTAKPQTSSPGLGGGRPTPATRGIPHPESDGREPAGLRALIHPFKSKQGRPTWPGPAPGHPRPPGKPTCAIPVGAEVIISRDTASGRDSYGDECSVWQI